MEILIKKLNDQAKLPVYSSEVEPGIDLYNVGDISVEPGASVGISTGVAMALPVGYVGVVRSPKNMTASEAVMITANTVDSSYRSEIIIELKNVSSETKFFAAGELVAQLIVQKVEHASLIEANDLSGGE